MKRKEHHVCELNKDNSERVFYDNPEFPVFIRTNLIPAGCVLNAVNHWHEDVEFIYVVDGSIKYHVNDSIFTLHMGEGIFINSKQMHVIVSDNGKSCLLHCVLMHPSLLCGLKYMEKTFVTPLLCNESIPFLLFRDSVGWQAELLSNLAKICDCVDGENAEIKIQRLLWEVWEALFQNLEEGNENPVLHNEQLELLKRMLAFIHMHYHEKITLAAICDAGNIGKSSCCQLFQKYVACTPIEYVVDYRLCKGARLLSDTDISVTEICYESGFSDISYFCKRFKGKFGCSPNQYRRNRQ